MVQLSLSGPRPAAASRQTAELQEEFAERRCALVTSLLEPRLLRKIQEQMAQAPFAHRAHGTISTELCMQPHACVGLLHFLVNDEALFRFVEAISGCRRLSRFVGRVYRMLPGGGHYDSWHSDLNNDHQLGMSLNLSTAPFDGGVFEIRRIGAQAPLAAVPNVGPGDAIIFAIADDLEHRVTPMRGAAAKTAFAGWFGSAGDYRDVLHHDMTQG